MYAVQTYLSEKQEHFKSHPFFEALNKKTDFSEGMSFVPQLAFWVLVFQDILNIIPREVKAAYLRRIATHHKHEDAGHDKWFLEDMAYLGKKHILTIEWLFSPEHRITRDVAYRIISEAFHGKDYQKIILILALESTGHIFFEHIAKFAKNTGHDATLKYFSSHHLEVEMNHVVFEEKLKEELYQMVLSEEERHLAIGMIDRVYSSFYILFDYLLESLNQDTESREQNEPQSLVA